MTRVFTAANPLHARLIVGLLEENGIAAHIEGEQLSAAHGALPFTEGTSPSVMVQNDADAARARELIARHDVSVNPRFCGQCGYDLRGLPQARCPECGTEFRRTHMWRCAGCGEVSEVQFTHCWHCGQGREGSAEVAHHQLNAMSKLSPSAPVQTPCSICSGQGRIRNHVIVAITFLLGLLSVLMLIQLLFAIHHYRAFGLIHHTIFYAPLIFICFLIAYRHRYRPCECVEPDGHEEWN